MTSYNYPSFGQCEVDVPDYRQVAKVGEQAPDFNLIDLAGDEVTLSSFRGQKHVLLEFGSIT